MRRRYRGSYLDVIDSIAFDEVLDTDGNYVRVTSEGVTRAQILEELAVEKSRLDSIGNTYQTADKIITGEDISVSVSNDEEMTDFAKNNGREIIYNANVIEDLDTSTLVSMNGINYHELAHVLFSPRQGSTLGRYVHDNDMRRAFNMLEEGRIERLLVAKYPSTRLYLEAMVLDYYFKGEPNTWGDLFPVVTSRRYLDLELRQMVADKFINSYGAELAQKVSSIMNEYSTLSFPVQFDRGMELIAELTEIVGKDVEPQPRCTFPLPPKDKAHTDRNVPQQGRPTSAKEQKRLQDKQPMGEGEQLFDNKDKTNGDPSDTPSVGVGGNRGEGLDVEQKAYSDDDKRLADLLSNRLNSIYDDNSIKSDVRNLRKSIIGDDEVRNTLTNTSHYTDSPSVTAVTYARKFGIELERMVRNNDPAWEKETPVGRLNVARTMSPNINNIGRVFDRWDIGNPNTDIEAVILLDNSGSMGYYMNEVCEKAWIIKRGIESIEGSVTVYNFNSYSEVLYTKDDKAKPRGYRTVRATGSTNPIVSLIEAERILTNSTKPIKMLFMVTDGYWDRRDECDSIIARLNKQGVLTSLVFMGEYEMIKDLLNKARTGEDYSKEMLKELRHGASIFKAVAEPKDILELAVTLVKSKVGARHG